MKMENKSYELVVSNNMEYVAGLCWKNERNDRHEMKIWHVGPDRLIEMCALFVDCDFGGERFAVSNDGRYAATARYEDFEEGNVHVYSIESGEDILRNVSLKRIQWIAFHNDQKLMVGTENDGIMVYDLLSQSCCSKVKGIKYYGENILLLSNQKTVVYKGKKFKSSTFSFLDAEETPMGILLSEAGGDLCYYKNAGDLYWKTDCRSLGHFIKIHYDRKQNIVLGVLRNTMRRKPETCFAAIDCDTGKILFTQLIENSSYVFVENQRGTVLANGAGKIIDNILQWYKIKEDV